MKLLRLHLENFRQHADTNLTFGEGMTAIVGPNGSGKSTLVEAIGFALYGEQRDKKETIRFHWGKGRRFAVTLEFEFDGRLYRVERTHSDASLVQLPGSLGASRSIEPSLTPTLSLPEKGEGAGGLVVRAHGLAETSRACERLLGLTFDQFVNSFWAEQKGLAFLQFRTNAARQEEVARMLGFDRLRLAEDLAVRRRREIAIEREAREKSLFPREALREQVATAKRTFVEAESRAKSVAKNLSTLERDSAAAAEHRALAERWIDLDRRRVALLGEINGHRALLDSTLKLRDEAEAAATEMEIPPETSLEKAEEEVERLTAELRKLELAWDMERAAARGAVASAATRLELAEESLQQVKSAAEAGICPECGQPIAGGNQRIQDAESRVASLTAEVQRLKSEEECANTVPRAVQHLRERLAIAQSMLANAQGAERARQERLRRVKELEARTRAVAVASAELREVEERKDAVEREQGRLPFASSAAATEAVARAQALAEETAKRRAELAHAESLRGISARDLVSAEARLAEQESLEREVADLRRREALHEACAREMRMLRQELNTGIGPDLAFRASENLSLLTNGRYLALELDRNFSASVVEDGMLKPVISGGEEDVVALALRLALSELIQERQGQPMSLLILDEVFGALDVERRQSVLDRLAALRGRFGQILVITHLEEVHQVADRTIYLRRDPLSRATVVSDEAA